MNILARALIRIAEEIDEADFLDQYHITYDDFKKAKANPIFGYLFKGDASGAYWVWCSENREKVLEVAKAVKDIVSQPGYSDDESYSQIEKLENEPGVFSVSDEGGDLLEIGDEYVADINGTCRLIDVINYFPARF